MLTGGPACQSCGRPMGSDSDRGGGRPDNPYCRGCTDKSGNLLSYETVKKGLVEREFIGRNGMERPAAEEAAGRAMSVQPAWRGR